MTTSWKNDYKLGIYHVDIQHKRLFELLDQTITDIAVSAVNISKTIGKLDGYAKIHFKTEEDYFEKYNLPDFEKHIELHKVFTEGVEKLLAQKNIEEETALIKETIAFLNNWLIDHIIKVDVKYAPILEKKLKEEDSEE